jgi:hypothetical protein
MRSAALQHTESKDLSHGISATAPLQRGDLPVPPAAEGNAIASWRRFIKFADATKFDKHKTAISAASCLSACVLLPFEHILFDTNAIATYVQIIRRHTNGGRT